MSDKNTSTLQSVIDTATGAVQSSMSAITGNTADQNAGKAKKEKAQAEHDASQATLKAGPLSASSSGAVTKDDPKRTEGSYNQVVGSGKEFVAGMVGSEQLKREGRDQNIHGQGQEAQGQLNDLGSGMANRVAGTLQGAFAGATGNTSLQKDAQDKHDVGKTQQRGAEADIQKQNS